MNCGEIRHLVSFSLDWPQRIVAWSVGTAVFLCPEPVPDGSAVPRDGVGLDGQQHH